MACSQCQGIERFFNQRTAERQVKQYRKRGPDRTTRALIAALEAESVSDATLLDIGGGVGVVQMELLKAGVRSATDVDASSAYLATAKAEAEREGIADRVEYRSGDFVSLAPSLPAADIVTLDRVVCCYPDMRALVGASSSKAARLYGLVYPRDTWFARAFMALGNSFFRLRGNPFRVFIHPTAEVDAVARGNGLALRSHRRLGFWQVVVYARSA